MSVGESRPTAGDLEATGEPTASRPHGKRILIWVLIGVALAQAAWILALPPFRGTDEFNHAFRAASVARGEWRPPHHVAEYGRGDLVRVPSDIVKAAYPQCASLQYTLANDCTPVRSVGGGQVLIATSASRYMPIYYWVVGTAALPFQGAGALYAMRIASSLLCLLFVGLAVSSVGVWARTAWPMGTVLVALTPVTVFSSVVVAPNGLEICAAIAAWCAVLGLARAQAPAGQRRLLYLMIPSVLVLAVVRPLGPGFLALLLLTGLVAQGPKRIWSTLRTNALPVLLVGATALAGVAVNVYWLTTSALSQVALRGHNPDALISSLRLLPSQVLQVYAAFPYRDVPAPAIVYACMALVSVAALVAGVRQSRAVLRAMILAATLGVFAGPFVFTLVTFATKGSFWQGRYGLPFIVGVPLLIGLALDRRPPTSRLVKPVTASAAALLVIAHTVSPTHVMDLELKRSVSVEDPTWVHPATWVVALLIVLGSGCCVAAIRAQHLRNRSAATEDTASNKARGEYVRTREHAI